MHTVARKPKAQSLPSPERGAAAGARFAGTNFASGLPDSLLNSNLKM